MIIKVYGMEGDIFPIFIISPKDRNTKELTKMGVDLSSPTQSDRTQHKKVRTGIKSEVVNGAWLYFCEKTRQGMTQFDQTRQTLNLLKA